MFDTKASLFKLFEMFQFEGFVETFRQQRSLYAD